MVSVETVRTAKASGQEGAMECDVTCVKLLSMSKYPQRGERIIKYLSRQGSLTSSMPRLCPGGLPGKGGGLGQRGALLLAGMKGLVEVLRSLSPGHSVSSVALAAHMGFTAGHTAGRSGLGVQT